MNCPSRALGWLVGLLLALIAGGCGLVADGEEARICRQIIAGLEDGADRIDVVSVRRASRTATPRQGPGEGVEVDYRLGARDAATGRLRTIGCFFDPSRADLKPAERIVAIETRGGPLSASRIYMLKRFWLDTIPGSVDPEPVPGAHRAPEVPRPLAIGAQAIIAGLPQMALLPLLAAAYALVYGLVGRINLAFGDLVSVGGYAALVGIAVAGGGAAPAVLAIGAAVLLAMWSASLTSAASGHIVFEPLHHVKGQSALIACAGLAIVLAEAVRLIRAGGPRSGPPILNDPLPMVRADGFIVTVTPMAIVVTLLAAAGIAGLLAALRWTSLGRSWRAVSDDPLAAALMGVSLPTMHGITFVMSGLLAGLGGAIAAITYGSIAYAGGLIVGLKALMAAIIAGSGSVGGAALCGFGLALVEALWSALLPIEHRDAMVFVVLVFILIARSTRHP